MGAGSLRPSPGDRLLLTGVKLHPAFPEPLNPRL
jgi:hypothetical protein